MKMIYMLDDFRRNPAGSEKTRMVEGLKLWFKFGFGSSIVGMSD